ncbi:MAG: TenA family protein [Rhodospirillales bacterium]|nr:MAG: TenA family protein [Rhodospirillales bacterium]
MARVLWESNGGIAARVLAHPFVRGLGDGSLPIPAFQRYVAQDAYFLEAFARAYAFCLAHSRERADLDAFATLIGGVVDELRLHGAYAARWSVDLADVTPAPATLAYTSFLIGHARGGALDVTIAAMTPCMRLYAFLGGALARGDVAPLYAEWVRTYADPGFEALAATLEALLDRHAADTPAVRAAYRRAMELEFDFFDAASRQRA